MGSFDKYDKTRIAQKFWKDEIKDNVIPAYKFFKNEFIPFLKEKGAVQQKIAYNPDYRTNKNNKLETKSELVYYVEVGKAKIVVLEGCGGDSMTLYITYDFTKKELDDMRFYKSYPWPSVLEVGEDRYCCFMILDAYRSEKFDYYGRGEEDKRIFTAVNNAIKHISSKKKELFDREMVWNSVAVERHETIELDLVLRFNNFSELPTNRYSKAMFKLSCFSKNLHSEYQWID